MSEARCTLTRPETATRRSLAQPAAMIAFATAAVVATEFIIVGLLPGMARDLGISFTSAGHLVSAFALSSALLGPLLMLLFSRYEPRRVMTAALLPFAAGSLAATAVPNYGALLIIRILQGAALPVFVSTASAAIAGLAGRGREGWAVSLTYFGFIAGLVLAIPAGIVLADAMNWRVAFMALGGLSMIAALVIFAGFPAFEAAEPVSMQAQAAIIRKPIIQAHMLLTIILFTAMFAPYTYLAAFLQRAAGLDGPQIAAALAGFGLAGIPGNWIAGRMSDHGPARATITAIAVLAFAVAAVSLSGSTPLLLLPLLAVWGAAHAAVILLCQIRTMGSAPEAQAFAASLNISAANIGIAAGAAIGGKLVDSAGVEAAGLGGGAIAMVALILTAALMRAGALT